MPQSSVYMDVSAELLNASEHTGTDAQSNKQASAYREKTSVIWKKKRFQMALWEVVSEDKAGEAPSVSFREVIQA